MVKSVLFTKQKENNKESDKDKEFLSKKRAEPDTPPEKDIDMVKLKKKINDIMGSICSQNNNESSNADYLYKSIHKNYVLNEFTSNCLNYINKMITDVRKNHLKKFQGLFELNKIFISIIKELLMNEFELLLLSLYLESIDISLNSDIFSFQESLIYLCFFIKKLTVSSEIIAPINSFLIRKYQGFEAQFEKWVKLNSSILNNKFFFSYTEINQRFKEYNNSYSIYCKNNYIDYNLIIDRILTMSIPYNDCKNDNLFIDKKGNSSELGMDSFNTNNVINFDGKKKKINKNNEIFFTTNNSTYNKNNCNNNINKINNLYAPNFISTFPNGIFINTNNTNNPDINLGYLYSSNNNIYNHFNNNINNELVSPQIFNTEFIKINQSDPKARTTFKITNMNNSIDLGVPKNIINEDSKKTNAIKPLFTTEEDKKKENKNNVIEEEIKRNNVNTNTDSLDKNRLNLNKRNNKEISLTPNNLLYSLDNDNNNNINQNNHEDNNLIETIYRQINKDNININHTNNNLIKNNEIINANQNQNNIIAFNASQQIQDFNALKYGGNFGVNDYNPPSFLSSKNPCYPDLNNFYQSSFHPLDENLKQLYQSNENLFGSWMNSSKNFYHIINNNYSSKIGESGSINNINYTPINQMFGNNNALININNGSNNQNGKINIAQEKKPEENTSQNNSL